MSTAIATQDEYTPLVQLVLDSVDSPHSKKAYQAALVEFLNYWKDQGRPPFDRALVQSYKTKLNDRELAPSSVNVRLAAVRSLANEAEQNQYIEPFIATGIKQVKGVKMAGTRTGKWLTKEQAQALLNAPDVSTLKGLRDRAMLAVMVGTGLRRSEVAALTFAHLELVDSRWVILDLIGKRKRVRTVPVPGWVKLSIDKWANAAGISKGKVFRAVYRNGKKLNPDSEGLTDRVVWQVVKSYLDALGIQIAPHDLRRSFARLAWKAGAGVDQVQLALGHSSMETTEKYLGVKLDLQHAACDFIPLELEEE